LLHIGFEANEKAKHYDEGWSYFLNELAKHSQKTN